VGRDILHSAQVSDIAKELKKRASRHRAASSYPTVDRMEARSCRWLITPSASHRKRPDAQQLQGESSGDRGSSFRLLQGLSSLSFAVQSAFDAPGLVAAVARHVLELARADYFSLLLLDYETGELKGDRFEHGTTAPKGVCRVMPRPAASSPRSSGARR